ncbi:TPA: hypothetical protein ACSTJZ_003141 [Serratia fonticola]
MTISTLTTKDIQLIYESAVHDEATKSDESGFVLDCVLDDAGGTGAVIRKLIDMVRARDADLLAVREAQSKPVGMQYRLQVPNITGWSLWHNGDGDKYREHYEVQQRLVYAAPPALPANVIGRPATPDDSPYPATISGGCLLAQAWADGYNMRNAVTAAPESLDDTRRMDWLVAHHVEVRKPLLYGSEKFFTAQTLTDREDDYHATSLREQIDAAMAAAPTPTKAGE